MSEQNTAPDLESAAEPNLPDGTGGGRPPAANQRGSEALDPGTDDQVAPADSTDSTDPTTPSLPLTGAHRPSAPSGEVAPS